MTPDARFWRNVIIIGVVHVAVLLGLARWSSGTKRPRPTEVLWLEGGTPAVSAAAAPPPMVEPRESETAEPEQSPTPVIEEQEVPPQPSDFAVGTPSPSPTATPTPSPTATPTPTAKPTATPKPSPTPKVKATPKLSPTATPKPKPSPTPRKKGTPAPERSPQPTPTASPKPTTEPTPTAESAEKSETATPGSNRAETSGGSGSGTKGAGSGRSSPLSSYASMLHDRFYSQWVQPTSLIAPGARMSTLVKLRIEKDGRVSAFTIIRSSGNVVVDESVAAVAKRVTRVDPLPTDLGSGFYEVNINFELKAEQ